MSQNMLSMLKSGSSKLPLDRVASLARALDCDPAYLLRLTLDRWSGTLQRMPWSRSWEHRSDVMNWGGSMKSVERSVTAIPD